MNLPLLAQTLDVKILVRWACRFRAKGTLGAIQVFINAKFKWERGRGEVIALFGSRLQHRMIESNHTVLFRTGLIDKDQFDRILFVRDLGLLSFENSNSFLALGIAKDKLAKHQQANSQVDEDISAAIAKEQ